jgi:hypothetical protein
MLIVAMLFGCEAIDDAKDTIDGATERTVMQGTVLAVLDPQDPTIGPLLAASPFAPGTSATVMLADAAEVSEMADSPILGATVSVDGAALSEKGQGTYTITPDVGPDYVEGATWTIGIDRGDGEGERTAMVTLPPPASGVLDASGPGGTVPHTVGTALSADLSGFGYASAIVAVLAPDGSLAYSNEPKDINELYEALQSEDAGTVEIPADAFGAPGLYAVGIAGLEHTTADDVDGLNTIISKARAGQMVFWPVTVE